MKNQKSINMKNTIWSWVDSARGEVSRSRFVEKLVLKAKDGYKIES